MTEGIKRILNIIRERGFYDGRKRSVVCPGNILIYLLNRKVRATFRTSSNLTVMFERCGVIILGITLPQPANNFTTG